MNDLSSTSTRLNVADISVDGDEQSFYDTVDRLAAGKPLSQTARVLPLLLDAVNWHGTPRQLAEALTEPLDTLGHRNLRNSMANLRFKSWKEPTRLRDIDPRLLPTLFVTTKDRRNIFVWRDASGEIKSYDAKSDSLGYSGNPAGFAYFFSRDDEAASTQTKRGESWLGNVARRFERFGFQILGLTFILNMLALATPFFVKQVYDKVIATGDKQTLVYLFIGVGIAILADAVFRFCRGALIAYLGGRFEMLVGSAAVEKIMDLPMRSLERSAAGTQIARLREFEGIRSFFAGPMALAFLEMPFTIIFVVAIATIGGWIALVPVVLMAVMGVFGFFALRYLKNNVKRAVKGSADCQSMLIELLENARNIKADATEGLWMARYREKSTLLSLSNLKNGRVGAMVQTFGQFIMVLAGAATLSIGVIAAQDGGITVGALIASMALVWRVLSPMQMLFLALTRLEEVKNAVVRIDQLMAQPAETRIRNSAETVKKDHAFQGRVTFSNVVLRYRPNHDPALAGVSFDINPGEVVAIAGANGSGKSSILKLLVDLYQPNSGAVLVDGVDTRQLNLVDLRHGIAYMPQGTDLFSGTIAENLRLANPIATDGEMIEACRRAGVWDDVESFGGLHTYLSEQSVHQMSAGFRRGLVLARTVMSDAGIFCFDEPGSALDIESDKAFIELVRSWKGKTTVLLVTHRPSYIREADRVIVLNRGQVTYDGAPEGMAQAAQQAAQSAA